MRPRLEKPTLARLVGYIAMCGLVAFASAQDADDDDDSSCTRTSIPQPTASLALDMGRTGLATADVDVGVGGWGCATAALFVGAGAALRGEAPTTTAFGDLRVRVELTTAGAAGTATIEAGTITAEGTRACLLAEARQIRVRPAALRRATLPSTITATYAVRRGQPRPPNVPPDCHEGSYDRTVEWASLPRKARPLPRGFAVRGFRLGMNVDAARRACTGAGGALGRSYESHYSCGASSGEIVSLDVCDHDECRRGQVCTLRYRVAARDPTDGRSTARAYRTEVQRLARLLGRATELDRYLSWDAGSTPLEGDPACRQAARSGDATCLARQWGTLWTRWLFPGGSVLVTLSGALDRTRPTVNVSWYRLDCNIPRDPIEQPPFRPDDTE